jgi:cytochrome c-type biogenesis protein CcmE
MTRKRKRLMIVLAAMALLAGGAALVGYQLRENIALFKSPSEIAKEGIAPGRRFRVGGLVEEHSVKRGPDGVTISFRVTDLSQSLPVTYRGIVPDLFREGQGVVAEGQLDPSGTFVASEVLAKHDERYMPPEVAKTLPPDVVNRLRQQEKAAK